jgi:hypothetical protein
MNSLQTIPCEIIETIIEFIEKIDLYSLLQVSRFFANFIRNSKVWSKIEPNIIFTNFVSHFLKYSSMIEFYRLFDLEFDFEPTCIFNNKLSEYKKYQIRNFIEMTRKISFPDLFQYKQECKILSQFHNENLIIPNKFIENVYYYIKDHTYIMSKELNILNDTFIKLNKDLSKTPEILFIIGGIILKINKLRVKVEWSEYGFDTWYNVEALRDNNIDRIITILFKNYIITDGSLMICILIWATLRTIFK